MGPRLLAGGGGPLLLGDPRRGRRRLQLRHALGLAGGLVARGALALPQGRHLRGGTHRPFAPRCILRFRPAGDAGLREAARRECGRGVSRALCAGARLLLQLGEAGAPAAEELEELRLDEVRLLRRSSRDRRGVRRGPLSDAGRAGPSGPRRTGQALGELRERKAQRKQATRQATPAQNAPERYLA